jgi:hypothetical protein
MGAGLHVAALFLDHETRIDALATVLSVAIPVTVFVGALYAVYSFVMHEADSFHIGLLLGTAAVLATSVILAAAGVDIAVCLIVLMFAPVVTVVGFELVGHRHLAVALERMRG